MLTGRSAAEVALPARTRHGVTPVFNRVDTCAAEFESLTPYLYSCYETEDEADPSDREKVVVLGSGPNRIGQGLEFDYCCVHAAEAITAAGYESVMINCNPETVSTDYDTSDRLYFEPLTFEDVMAVVEREKPKGVLVQFGGQTPLKLAKAARGRRRPDSRHLSGRDRPRRGPRALRRAPAGGEPAGAAVGRRARRGRGPQGRAPPRLPASRPAELRARRPRDAHRLRRGSARDGPRGGDRRLSGPAGPHRPVPRGRLRARRRRPRRRRARRRRGRHAAHRGGGHPLRRLVRRLCRRTGACRAPRSARSARRRPSSARRSRSWAS